jgi:hypothetical protein
MNMSQLCKGLLAVHHYVGRLVFAAMMPGLSVDQVKALKRRERAARNERKRLCALIRAECRLRVDAWDAGRRYSELEARVGAMLRQRRTVPPAQLQLPFACMPPLPARGPPRRREFRR